MAKRNSEREKLSRRDFACRLALAATGGMAALALAARASDGAVVVDLTQAEFAPLREVGGAVKVVLEDGALPVIVTRVDEGKFAAFSSECTHWGCEVALPDEEGVLRCPCHTSLFDMEGRLIEGEALSDLHRVAIEVQTETAVEGRSWGRIKKDHRG